MGLKEYTKLSAKQRALHEVALAFVSSGQYVEELLPVVLHTDKVFWEKWLEHNIKLPNIHVNWRFPKAAFEDETFMLKVLEVHPMLASLCAPSLRQSPAFFLKVACNKQGYKKDIPIACHFDKGAVAVLADYPQIALDLVALNPDNYTQYPEILKFHKEIIKLALCDLSMAKLIPNDVFKDTPFVLELLESAPKLFGYLPKFCRDDPNVQKVALAGYSGNYQYLYSPARNDPAIIKKVLEADGELFAQLPQKERNKKEYFYLALESITKNTRAGGLSGYRLISRYRRLMEALNQKVQDQLHDLGQELFKKDVFSDPLILPQVASALRAKETASQEAVELSKIIEKKDTMKKNRRRL